MTDKYIKRTEGFTLVELSIVIIIIGFLIAGIAAGKSLIRQTQLNSIITESQMYILAINTFKDRYSYYPGDLPNAEAYWPTTNSGGGDGVINNGEGSWDHLVAAGMINPSFNNNGEPNAKFGNQTFWRLEGNFDSVYTIPSNTRGSLEILNDNGFILTASEGYQIDNKLDDGKPAEGKIYAVNSYPFTSFSIVNFSGSPVLQNYNSTEVKYDLSFPDLGIARMYFYLD